jgi:hypothetical protein
MLTARRTHLVSALAIALLVGACTAGAPPTDAPATGIAPRVSTPFPAFAAADPPAQLHDRPGGAPGAVLPRGTDLQVEEAVVGPDGRLWYRIVTADGASGWLAGAALSLVDDPVLPSPTPLATVPPPPTATPVASPTPGPLVVAGSGSGLFLRREPGQGEIIAAYPDGTAVTPLGQERTLDGRRWLRVRTPDGRDGWMAADYLHPGP